MRVSRVVTALISGSYSFQVSNATSNCVISDKHLQAVRDIPRVATTSTNTDDDDNIIINANNNNNNSNNSGSVVLKYKFAHL